jgi:hypothetical protein
MGVTLVSGVGSRSKVGVDSGGNVGSSVVGSEVSVSSVGMGSSLPQLERKRDVINKRWRKMR